MIIIKLLSGKFSGGLGSFLLLILALPVHAETYTYDSAGRLTGVVYDDGSGFLYTYDANGNQLARTLVSADTTPPIVTAPSDIMVLATSASGVPASHAAINAFLNGASANDDVDGALLTSNDAPMFFPVGSTTVTFSATDAASNTGTDTAKVTVEANVAPTASAGDLILSVSTTATLQVSASDANPGDVLSYAVTGQGTLGTASVDANGLVTYSAGAVAGQETIQITVTDTANQSVVVDIAVTVNAAAQTGGGGGGSISLPGLLLVLCWWLWCPEGDGWLRKRCGRKRYGNASRRLKLWKSRGLHNLWLALLAGFSIAPAQAVVVCPSCTYTTIESALTDPATVGQVIQLDPAGSPYMEGNLNVTNGRSLESLTPGDKGSVIIDGSGTPGTVISISNGNLTGLRITGGNSAAQSGGVDVAGTVTISNCIIDGNQAASFGGGIGSITGGTVLIIDNSDITNNTAYGSGGGVGGNSSKTITNSLIANNLVLPQNNATGSGGGVFLDTLGNTNHTISNTSIINNRIQSGTVGTGTGGGVSLQGGANNKLTMLNVILQDNSIETGTTDSRGGGLYVGVGDVTVYGGDISGNSANQGGGMYISNTPVITISTAVSANTATLGGGIMCASANTPVTVSGSVSGNTPDQIAGCSPAINPAIGARRTAADSRQSGSSNDPVNTFTGELFDQLSPDIDLGGPMPLLFARYYASGLEQAGILANLGSNWRHNFDWTLSIVDTQANIINQRGRTIQFANTGTSWDLVGKLDIAYQLVESAGSYTLLDPISQISYQFDMAGKLTSIADGHGNVHSLNYADGLLASISDGLGRTLNLTYNTSNELVSVDDGAGRSVSFSYASGNLSSVTDLNGTTTYSYAGNLLSATQRPLGNTPFMHSFDSNGMVSAETDANTNLTSFSYSLADTTITDSLNNSQVHTHTATGELSNSMDQAGQNITIGSDATGRRNLITDRLGDISTLSYHAPSGKLASRTDAEGGITSFTYTARMLAGNTAYDLTGVTHADGATESFVYDASGNMTSHIDELGNTANATYNGNGQLLTATNRLSGVSVNTYSADATLASSTDPAGNTTTFGYDMFSRPNLITHADGTARSISYDLAGQPLSMTDENGNTTVLSWDANGNLVSVQDPLMNTVTLNYDDNDRLLSLTDSLGGTSSQSFDAVGRVASVTDANGNTANFTYDALGRLTSIGDPLLNAWSLSYDAENIITSITDPLGNTTNFVSDRIGRITQTTSPLGNIDKVNYDAMGRITSTIDALGQATTFSRDAAGQVTGIELPGGTISTTITRNAMGEPSAITDPNGNIQTRSYDNSGRLIAISDPLGNTVTIGYDNRNRPATINYPAGLGTQILSYDATGNLIAVNYSDGTSFGFSYDANDRLIAANNGGATANNITRAYDMAGRLINSNGIAITRDAGGRVLDMTLAPGKTVTYTYDANNRVNTVTDWAGGVTSFSYDNAGRLTSIIRPNGVNQSNSWDSDSRLIGISEGGLSSINLSRDAKGQITAATRTVPQKASAVGLSNRSNTFDAASQINGNSYDALGRQTAEGADSFVWDAASRLITYTVAGTTVSNTYDALGYRTQRTAGGVSSEYVWNSAPGIETLTIERRDGTDFRYFIHTPGGILLYSIDAADARTFYHFDEMGNTLFLTNDAGAVTGSYAYTPYGELIAANGGQDNPFTWQGRNGTMDEGNGLYYMRARYYDATTGRFISRDPITTLDPVGINPYQYALNNPLGWVDATGRKPVSEGTADAGTLLVNLLGTGLKSNAGGIVGAALGVVTDSVSLGITLSKNDVGLKDVYFGGGAAVVADVLGGGLAIAGSELIAPVVIAASGAKVAIDVVSDINDVIERNKARAIEAQVAKIRKRIRFETARENEAATRKAEVNRQRSIFEDFIRKRQLARERAAVKYMKRNKVSNTTSGSR